MVKYILKKKIKNNFKTLFYDLDGFYQDVLIEKDLIETDLL